MRRLRKKSLDPRALWPTLVWVLIGVETLVILWFHVSFVPVDRSLDGYLWQCAVLFGTPGEHLGFVMVASIVNALVVIGLWIVHRSSRHLGGPAARATLLSAILGTLVLAAIGWWGVKARDRCRPLQVKSVLEMGADGEYAAREEALSSFAGSPAVDLISEDSGTQVLCFNEAHHNVHTSVRGYTAFAEIARDEGFDVVPLAESWGVSGLTHCDLLVVASPRGAPPEATLREKAKPAFTGQEMDLLDTWLQVGGSLLLVTDHPPIGSAAEPLSGLLGIEVSLGFVEDPEHANPEGGFLVFSRANGLLASHEITDGASPGESVEVVGTFLGQSLSVYGEAVSLLTMGSEAQDRFRRKSNRQWLPPGPDDKLRPAGGRSQAIAMEYRHGRAVVLGEAGMFASRGDGMGIETAGLDNRQFAINILRWLGRDTASEDSPVAAAKDAIDQP
jgi:hypothetical protein